MKGFGRITKLNEHFMYPLKCFVIIREIFVFTTGARLSGNEMLHQYHPGAFGKDVPGQWSCCKRKTKAAIGCSDISQLEACPIDRTQSVTTCTKKDNNVAPNSEISASVPDMQKEKSIPKPNYYEMTDTFSLKSQGKHNNIMYM